METTRGSVLTLTRIVAGTLISESPDGRVTLTLNTDTFSFRDDDGDRWTYIKQ